MGSMTIEAARSQFPIARHRIYFDTANSATPPTCVTQAVNEFLRRQQDTGPDKKAWLAEVERTRALAAGLLDCHPTEIAFVKNTSEAINIAAHAIDWRPGDNVVIPRSEHPNNVYPWLNLRRRGVEVRLVPEAGNWVDGAMLRPFVDARTRAVAVADVAFHPGQRNDLASIAGLCDTVGAHLVVDGVQAAGLMNTRPRALGVAMWAASGHKGLMTPHGLGLLFCRRELIPNLMPAYAARASMAMGSGDDHLVQDPDVPLRDDARRFELGNANFSATHAMAAALDLIAGIGIDVIERHVLDLGESLTEGLAQRQVRRLGPSDPARRSSICAFELPDHGWAEHFAEHDIIVSARRDALRVSFGIHNTRDDVGRFLEVFDRRPRQ